MKASSVVHKHLDPHLAVNPNAVVEVAPLVGTQPDPQCVGEAGDESILEGTPMERFESSETTLICTKG